MISESSVPDTIIVTGAAGALGQAIATYFAGQGAHVAGFDIVDEAIASLDSANGWAWTVWTRGDQH